MYEKYVKIGDIRNLLTEHYTRFNEKVSFDTVLKEAIVKGLYETTAPYFKYDSNEISSTEDFIKLIDSIYILLNPILENPQKHIISENYIIPPGRDVETVCHLPYVDDDMHEHNHFEIDYVYRGQAKVKINQESRIIKTGEVYIFSPDMSHNLQVEDDRSIVIGIMVRKSTFDNIFKIFLMQNTLLGEFFRNIIYHSEKDKYLMFHVNDNDWAFKNLVQERVIETNSNSRYSNEISNCLVQQLFFLLLRNYSDTITYYASQDISNEQADFLMILEYVQSHYSTTSLEQLAKFFNYSQGHLSRMFKKNLGTNFIDVLSKLKLEKAKDLLENTTDSICDIAVKVGYDSADYFTRAFKARYGLVPTKYRKAHKKME